MLKNVMCLPAPSARGLLSVFIGKCFTTNFDNNSAVWSNSGWRNEKILSHDDSCFDKLHIVSLKYGQDTCITFNKIGLYFLAAFIGLP